MEAILTALVLIVSLCVIFICADIFTVARLFERLRNKIDKFYLDIAGELGGAGRRSATISKTLCDLCEETEKLANNVKILVNKRLPRRPIATSRVKRLERKLIQREKRISQLQESVAYLNAYIARAYHGKQAD